MFTRYLLDKIGLIETASKRSDILAEGVFNNVRNNLCACQLIN